MGQIDYALFISLALYGGYVAMVARSERRDGRMLRVIIAMLMAIVLYTVLKQVFIAAGIQTP